MPRANLVVVHLRNTYVSFEFNSEELWMLQEMILDARVGTSVANPRLIPLHDPPGWFETVALENSTLDRYVGDYEFENGVTMAVKREGDTLLLENLPVWPPDPPTRLLPISEKKFILEDVGHTVTFDLDGSDYHVAIEATPDHTSCGKRVRSKGAR
jgi:hypothetical protein